MILRSIVRMGIHSGTDNTALNPIQKLLVKGINGLSLLGGTMWLLVSIPFYVWSRRESIPLVCLAGAGAYFLIPFLNGKRKYTQALSVLVVIEVSTIFYFGGLLLPEMAYTLLNFLIALSILVAILYLAELYFRGKKHKSNNGRSKEVIAQSDYSGINEISHDYRVKLNGIYNLTSELALQIEENGQPDVIPVKSELINVLNSFSKSMLDLTNNVLDSAKIEAGKMPPVLAPINLAIWLHPIIQMYRVTSSVHKIQLRVSIADQVPPVFISDHIFLTRILSNLLSNAIKFSHTRGIIEIIIDSSLHDLIIKVKDSGIGIERAEFKSIFNYWNSGNHSAGGTGMGLAISKSMAEILGGTLEVESMKGIGSTFTLKFPLWIANSTPTIETSPGYRSLFGVKVLVVDDDRISHMVAATQLKRLGCFSYFCESSAKALVLVRKIKPDIILCDLNMPGLDGIQFLRELRGMDNYNDIPVIIVSGDTDRQYVENLPGTNGYLTKPVTLEQLHIGIDSLLLCKSIV